MARVKAEKDIVPFSLPFIRVIRVINVLLGDFGFQC
jgi:hypothetical protein